MKKKSEKVKEEKNEILETTIVQTTNKIYKEVKEMKIVKRKSRDNEKDKRATASILNRHLKTDYKDQVSSNETLEVPSSKKIKSTETENKLTIGTLKEDKKIQQENEEKEEEEPDLSYESLPKNLNFDLYSGYPLSSEIMKEIERLGGTFPSQGGMKRFYSKYSIPIPLEIQFFLEIRWPCTRSMGESETIKCKFENFNKVKNDEYEIFDLEFVEYDLEERNEYKFLNENPEACLIGDGNVILCTLLKSKELKDFLIYILDDSRKNDVEGPIKLSNLLSGLTIDDGSRIKKK